MKPINAALKQMKADGTLKTLDQKWFVDYKLNHKRHRDNTLRANPC